MTFVVMSASRLVASGPGAPRTASVPAALGFGHPTKRALGGGWQAYSFPDLDVTIELPATVNPVQRKFTPRSAQWVTHTADYSGWGLENIGLGAFWYTRSGSDDPVVVMNYNMALPEAQRTGLKYRIEATTIAGCPAAALKGTFIEGTWVADLRMVYFRRGNALYNVQCSYWQRDETRGDKDWERILTSIRFNSGSS